MHRDFSSEVALDVYREGRPPLHLGNTLDEDAAGDPIKISVPADGGWFVRPVDPAIRAEHLPAIVAEIIARSVPGLSLAGCRQIDDAALAGLVLAQLERLDLFNTAVGDQGLAWLHDVPALRRLSLAGTKLDDTGLRAVAALPTLTELDLGWTAVTDQGLEHLRAHPALVALSLRGTRVSDRGLDAIATIPHLTHLDLQETGIGDASVARLRPLARTLEHLLVGYTALTHRCVADLAVLEGLRTLMIRVTGIGSEYDGELAARLRVLGTDDGRGIVR